MSEQNNDRLEEFFRKAAGKPDVSFNEDDWRKLEVRLDAQDLAAVPSRISVVKWAAGILIASAVLFSGGIWLSSHYKIVKRTPEDMAVPSAADKEIAGSPQVEDLSATKADNSTNAAARQATANEPARMFSGSGGRAKSVVENAHRDAADNNNTEEVQSSIALKRMRANIEASGGKGNMEAVEPRYPHVAPAGIVQLNEEKISGELVMSSSVGTVKIKQKAVVDLPGAEEVDRREAIANVSAEHASVQKQRLAAPRLSLLLSLAPDFSSTSSFTGYGTPGKAFGGWIQYHVSNRWAVSIGAIKNSKTYTGSGEYYKPPTGYWKRNTNGIVPSTIDGSCNLIEFPVMIRYTAIDKGISRWFVSAGASSYLMQEESYTYNFEEPNPGAKAGWETNRTSPFMFNMINFSLGYEHDVLPGFTVGLEPYIKLPIEDIGWPNVKLFSTGASITLRYALIGTRKTSKDALPGENRPPD